MSSTSKTLELLDYFTPLRPEIGLSELCRLAGRDKATTHRHLQALETAGFVEQNPVTRHYRLGPKLLQLAQARERTVPRSAGAEAPLRALAEATGETAHASVLSGDTLYRLMSFESPRHSIRVIIDIETFPLHATASGLCALAFGPAALLRQAVERMQSFTLATPATPEALDAATRQVRRTGFAEARGSFEPDVYSLAAPLFDQTGQFAGAVSVASIAMRFTTERERAFRVELARASREITRNWGGTLPDHVETAWATRPARTAETESTS
jgi:DNA-binding IclR family transcriptional regulator